MLPPDVLTGVRTLLEGRSLGLDYHDLRVGAPEQVAAVEAWLAASAAP